MKKAWKVRREDQAAKRLVKKAATRLTEAGVKEQRGKEEQRKRVISRRLENLIEKQKVVKRRIQSLPLIPKVTDNEEEQDLPFVSTGGYLGRPPLATSTARYN